MERRWYDDEVDEMVKEDYIQGFKEWKNSKQRS